jgi:hypothetical protein
MLEDRKQRKRYGEGVDGQERDHGKGGALVSTVKRLNWLVGRY